MIEVWVTRDGTAIPLDEMEDLHLLRASALCHRMECAANVFHGDMAELAFDQAQEFAYDQHQAILAELGRRGIDPADPKPGLARRVFA